MKLSEREKQVLACVAMGKTTKETSAALGIAGSTVDWHIAKVLVKLEASSRAEAVFVAARRGLLARRGPVSGPDLPPVAERTRRGARAAATTHVAANVTVLGLALAQVTVVTRTRKVER